MPSFWSAVANSAWNSRRSNITPSDRPLSKARLTDSLAAITAICDKSAITSAAPSASSISLS